MNGKMLRLQQVPQLTQSTQAPLCENSMQIAWVGGGRGEHITGYYIHKCVAVNKN